MIYLPKEGSEAYKYIKGILDAEEKEKKAYFKRVEEAVGFEVERYSGYQPNRCLVRKFEITALLVTDEQYDKMDHKIWKLKDRVQGFNQIAPNKRCKEGKRISEVFMSFKPIKNFWQIHGDLGIPSPDTRSFSATQLLFDGIHYYIYFDDDARADKHRDDLEEITMGRYEDMVAEANKIEEQKIKTRTI